VILANLEGMADTDDDNAKTLTHVVWALQHRRVRRTVFTVPLEIGAGRIDPDGTPRLFLDREPKGGYGGYYAEIILLPRGVKPGAKTAPERPGQADEDDELDS
jgi:hypothetical protein